MTIIVPSGYLSLGHDILGRRCRYTSCRYTCSVTKEGEEMNSNGVEPDEKKPNMEEVKDGNEQEEEKEQEEEEDEDEGRGGNGTGWEW